MIFNSLTYLILLVVFIPTYWFLPYKPRLIFVFFTSLIFYGFWRIEFIPLLLFSTISDWLIANQIYKSNKPYKKFFLYLSLTINLILLFYFKYLIFFIDNAFGLMNFFGLEAPPIFLKIILPLGISFYTFQTISYVVDVYRNKNKPENNFILYACYVTFFPQLIAGPILRSSEVIPQFKNRITFKIDFIFDGFKRVIYGLFLKVVIADNIAPLVDSGFAMNVDSLSGIDIWTLAFLFGFQIYFDFSAYSHIAIGSAKMIGLNFPENFNFPYLSNSPKEFWQKWHISLSSWIRDYLYLPLINSKITDNSTGGLNYVFEKYRFGPLFLTWAIMGFWHGANWTFLVWGIFHAIIIAFYRLINPIYNIFPSSNKFHIGIIFTLPLIMISWIPFRSENIHQALEMWLKILFPSNYLWIGMRENIYLVTSLLMIGIFIFYFLNKNYYLLLKKFKSFIIIEILNIAIIFSLVFIFLRPINQFIYFQF